MQDSNNKSLQKNTPNNIIFTTEEIQKLGKIRIIKRNLVHFQGFPYYLAEEKVLNKYEYLGQYGKIEKIVIKIKIDQVTNKKSFSVYVTFNTDVEASYSILAIDSLLIDGKIIRAFFGTTKYCKHFLNNIKCKNKNNCIFLHDFPNKEDIIGADSDFGYNDHINLAKKIIDYNSNKTRNFILNLKLDGNIIFPSKKDIYLREKDRDMSPQTNDFLSDDSLNDYICNGYNYLEQNKNFFNKSNINIRNNNNKGNNILISDVNSFNFFGNFNDLNNIKNINNREKSNYQSSFIDEQNIINNNNCNFNSININDFTNRIESNYENNNKIIINSNNFLPNSQGKNDNINNSLEILKQENLKLNLLNINIDNQNPCQNKNNNYNNKNFINYNNNSINENDYSNKNSNIIFSCDNNPDIMYKLFNNLINDILIRRLIFTNSNKLLKELELHYLKNYLKKLGLDLKIFDGCLDSLSEINN